MRRRMKKDEEMNQRSHSISSLFFSSPPFVFCGLRKDDGLRWDENCERERDTVVLHDCSASASACKSA